MVQTRQIVDDLHHLGFEWKVIESYKSYSVLRIIYNGDEYIASNKKPHIIWSVIRAKMRDLGYNGRDVGFVRTAMTASG